MNSTIRQTYCKSCKLAVHLDRCQEGWPGPDCGGSGRDLPLVKERMQCYAWQKAAIMMRGALLKTEYERGEVCHEGTQREGNLHRLSIAGTMSPALDVCFVTIALGYVSD